jgi:tetratricopeptide (TPR) repeat protein
LGSSRSEVFADACNLAQQGHYEEAKTAFLRVESDCQEYSKAQYLLGCACNKLNEYNEYKQAIAAFDLAIQSFKTNEVIIPVDLFYQKGLAHWKVGTYDDAIKNFSTFIRKKGKEDAYNGYLSRALVYCSMGHYEEALSDLNQANEDRENQTAYSLCCRGRTLAHLGQYEKAKEDFQAASHIDPQDFQSHLQLGIIYSELGEYSQALDQFNRALESVSMSKHNRAEAFFRQALVYQSLGHSDKATSMLLDAVALNPKHARAYFRLGRAYLAEGKYAAALEALNTAQTLAPHDRDIVYELGTLHERAERLNLALHERRRALGLHQAELPRLETPDSEKPILEGTPTPSPPRSPSPSIDRRRPMNPHLASALEQEELLPVIENRLASYYKTLEEYKLAIASGECPEARVFMALCQEAGNDFVDASDSMEQLYDDLQNDPDAYKSWLDCLKEFKNNKDLEKLSPFVAHRYFVMERIQANLTDIANDHESFENDSSQNRKLFYDTLRKRLGQSLVAFSVAGCDVSVVAHNLKGPLSK